MIEEWRSCVGFPEYQVSSLGNVKRVAAGQGVRLGKLASQYRDTQGYPMVHLYQRNKRHPIAVHRLVAEAFIGPKPSPDHHVAHNDGTKDNNIWTNLRWATPKENNADKVIHDTHNRGERHYLCKLSPDIVRLARKRKANGEQVKDIATDYGVCPSTMAAAIRGTAWGWVE